MVEALSKNSSENSRKICHYQQDIKKIKALICKLQSKTVIADPGPAVADGTTKPTSPKTYMNSITSTESTNSTNNSVL